MPRLLLRMSLVGVLVINIALMTMRIAGKYRPPQVVMVGLDTSCDGKPQPCWFGVVLGQTTLQDVQTLFGQFGDSFENNTIKGQIEIFKTTQGGCFAQFVYGRGGSTIINEIILTNCARVRLGDLLARYGEPETIGTSITCDAKHPVIQPNNYYIEFPEAGIIANINRPAMLRPWLSLQGNVRQLYLVKPHQTDGRKTWAGLVSFERFVRLHPEQIRNSSCGP
jgi:hypothetical protein